MKKWVNYNNHCNLKFLAIFLLLLANTSNMNNVMGETYASPISYGADLPDWISSEGYLGISDPLLDTIQAYDQAVQRALAFYAIGNNMNFSSVYEYYYLISNMENVDCDNQKSHWMVEFDVESTNLSYEVIKSYRTKYNETIVLLSVEQGEGDVDINVSGSFMYHYEYYNKRAEYGEKKIMTISSDGLIESLEWNSILSRQGYLKKTSINDEENTIIRYLNKYKDFGNVSDDMVFSNTEFGLWNSYIDTFLQALSIFESKYVVVENTSRAIRAEDMKYYDEKSQNLSRLVMRTNISCSLNDFSLKDNNFYANWVISER